MKQVRDHPTADELAEYDNKSLKKYALREAKAMREQKQTAVARLLEALAEAL